MSTEYGTTRSFSRLTPDFENVSRLNSDGTQTSSILLQASTQWGGILSVSKIVHPILADGPCAVPTSAKFSGRASKFSGKLCITKTGWDPASLFIKFLIVVIASVG